MKNLYQKDTNINIEEIDLGREKEPPPLFNEVESTLKKIKNRKAPGLDHPTHRASKTCR